MAASYLNDWAPAVKIAAHTEVLAQIDGSATAGGIFVYDASDTQLAEFTLDDPGGTVNGTTGQISLAFASTTTTGDATGTASYATLRNGDGDALQSLPCQQGSAAVSGVCVLTSLSIVVSKVVGIESWEIG